MDPGRCYRSPALRLLWLVMPPLLLAATSALALGFERLVHERLLRTQSLLAVLPGLETAARRANQVLAPLAPQENLTETTEQLHTLLTKLVDRRRLTLNSLAIDRHDEQPQAGAARLKVSASVDGRFPDLAALVSLLQDAEPLLITEGARWTFLRVDDEGDEFYRAEMLFSLYRVTP